MTQEEKAKAYDEALAKAKELYSQHCAEWRDEDIEYIFPELAESEDEKIRKEIVRFIQMKVEDEIVGNKWLAWLEKQGSKDKFIEKELGCIKGYRENAIKRLEELEKQGEQNDSDVKDYNSIEPHFGKPIDKIEPKFKVGYWVVWDNKISCHVDNIYQGKESLMYTITDTNNMTRSYSIKSFDNNAHLWTIQDAKDGDILTSIGFHSNCTFIFNGLDNWKFEEPNGNRVVATGYCCLTASADKMEFGIQGPDCIEVNTIKPATKIQCDLLFEKMKEVGYEWDAEKKELKKIEPKTEENKGNVGGISSNSAWSEDDETVLNNLIYALANDRIGNNRDEYVDWLKSLKGRVQPKQEWSEEDSIRLQRIIDFLWYNRKGDTDTIYQQEQDIDWLKSLRPQSQWKPTDEQIKVCKEVYADILSAKGFDLGTVNDELNRLEEELKKLKE